eukprot:890058-Alexandrium_andersonii.AAC.1
MARRIASGLPPAPELPWSTSSPPAGCSSGGSGSGYLAPWEGGVASGLFCSRLPPAALGGPAPVHYLP